MYSLYVAQQLNTHVMHELKPRKQYSSLCTCVHIVNSGHIYDSALSYISCVQPLNSEQSTLK